jgi:epoxide hydrolase-like predicted phosphatase
MASENNTYPGLLIDWGGVLTTSVSASFSAFCELEGLESDAVFRVFREDSASRELLLDFETGAIAEEQFEARLATSLGVPAPRLIERLFAATRPDDAMIEALRRARAGGVLTGLVSNSWGTSRYPRDLLAELFDGIVISGEVGMRKPTPEIYALGAERIGLPPADCVFVDDLGFNLAPAAELGMATVHHRESVETIAQLERLLGVRLR